MLRGEGVNGGTHWSQGQLRGFGSSQIQVEVGGLGPGLGGLPRSYLHLPDSEGGYNDQRSRPFTRTLSQMEFSDDPPKLRSSVSFTDHMSFAN